MKKIKISELPQYGSLKGLKLIAADTDKNKSVSVPVEDIVGEIVSGGLTLYVYWANVDCVSTLESPLIVGAEGIDGHKAAGNVYVCMTASARIGDLVTPDVSATTVEFANEALNGKYGKVSQGDALYYGGGVEVEGYGTIELWQRLTEYEAKSDVDGLMSKGDKQNLTQALTDIAALQTKTRYIGDGMVLKANDADGWLNWDKDAGVYFTDANAGDDWKEAAGEDTVPLCFAVTRDGVTYQYCVDMKTGKAYYRSGEAGSGSLAGVPWIAAEAGGVTYEYGTPEVSLSYPTMPNDGGETVPTVSYTQTATGSDGSTKTITDGGSLSWSCSDMASDVSFDTSTGKVTALANPDDSQRTLGTVQLTVTLNGKTGKAECTVYQEAAEAFVEPVVNIDTDLWQEDSSSMTKKVHFNIDVTYNDASRVTPEYVLANTGDSYEVNVESATGRDDAGKEITTAYWVELPYSGTDVTAGALWCYYEGVKSSAEHSGEVKAQNSFVNHNGTWGA